MASFKVKRIDDHGRELVVLQFFEKRETPTGVEPVLVEQKKFTAEIAKTIGTQMIARATEITNGDGDTVSLEDDDDTEEDDV